MSNYFTFNTLDAPPFWIWLVLIKEVIFLLLIFKVWSGNWMGRRKKYGVD